MHSVKQVFVGIFALVVAGTAFASTPVTPAQTHKGQVLFQGKWRRVPQWHEVALPLQSKQTVGQVEQLAKEISSDRAVPQVPHLWQSHDKGFLVWKTIWPATRNR